MATENRKKTLYYKHAQFFEHTASLSGMLTAAINLHHAAKDRIQRIGAEDKSVRLVNHFERLGRSAVCGTVLEFTEGNAQPIVELSDAPELPVSLMGTGDSLAQFVEGTVFFVVVRNHVVLAQSKALRATHVEQHFDWLLRRRTSLVPEGARVLLQEHVKTEHRQRFVNVRAVKLRPDYEVTDGAAKLTPVENRRRFDIREDLLETVVRVIQRATRRPLPAGLDLGNALIQKRLRATIELSVDGRMPEEGVPLLDGLAAALRNADDLDYVVQVPGVGDVRSGDLRLKYEVGVPFTDGMPDPSRLYVEMYNWLDAMLKSGELRDLE